MDKRREPWPARVIVYYDGDCALCNWSVARCLARGVPSGVRFAPQDGELFERLTEIRPDLAGLDSMVIQSLPSATGTAATDAGDGILPTNSSVGEIRVRSEAVIWLASQLRGPERWLALLPWMAPRPVLDWGYRLVARNRHRVGRRLAECPVPTPEQRRYFLA
jgi:predicted DCC family thiol-disulfide oxidoreductase YuxK